MSQNNIEKESFTKVLGALERMKEMSRKSQQKQDLKNWSDIKTPIILKDALARLSKDELSAIRKQFDIKNASQLKKGELIEVLTQQIPLLLEKIFRNMDMERYQIIKKIMDNGGTIVEPLLTARQFQYFRNSGILFTGTLEGKKILGMPEDLVKSQAVQEAGKPFMSVFQRNTEWIKLTQGLLYYYGTLSIQELMVLLEKYLNEPINLSDYLTVLEHASSYYYQIRMDHIGFSHIRVFDPEKVQQEQQMRKDLGFFPFTKEQLVRAGEPEYSEQNNSVLQFIHYLTENYVMSREEANVIVEECVFATKKGESPDQILQFLERRLQFQSLDSVQSCMEKVVNLMNQTRQWFLKGYTPEELSPLEQESLRPLPDRKDNIVNFTTGKKIGRNELCPCGSNKKYKKCCGR
ncbi:SEC-C metal-binding domain-containing protein [Neobacillus jeddahensis]|uniref:SEC-C metal-binding domain-containing protein n=1 Tax=Neobacillus jeddahensis TaxID=1461580 RepID=UPI00058DDD26|nr:SEC-C metal-binding domain-containing protein [Neobacillus jeddahensis]